jgi:hypothetical protein
MRNKQSRSRHFEAEESSSSEEAYSSSSSFRAICARVTNLDRRVDVPRPLAVVFS